MKKSIILGFFIVLLLNACMKDSALSDLEISDPSLIRPNINLTRTYDRDGKLITTIRVFLYDKNDNLINLKKGGVSVNGNTMKIKTLELTGGDYYTIDTSILKVDVGKLYTFIIELADDQKYNASILTQQTDLYALTLPVDYNKTDDMEIDWQGHETGNNFEIQLMCDYNTDTILRQTNDIFTPNYQEKVNGAFTIPKSFFNQKEGIFNARVIIRSKTLGTIDSRFNDSSQIYSIFEKHAECGVN